MPNGWAALGDAIAGDSEVAYQQGRLTGAKTEDALTQARARVDTERARLQLEDDLVASGVPRGAARASSTGLRAGANLGDAMTVNLRNQEFNNRATASDPNIPLDVGQRAMLGVGSGPVSEPIRKIGNGSYNIFDTAAGIQPLPEGVVPHGGDSGEAATMQLLRGFGLVDANGHITDRVKAFTLLGRNNVTAGGVPYENNPFAGEAVGGLPAPGAHAVVSPGQTASNAADVERAKVVATGSGNAEVALPDALADINKLRGNINTFRSMPGYNGVYGNVQGQPLVRPLTGLASQDIADAQGALKNIDAQTFGIAVQKMRGLGQLSNAEGVKVTDAFTRAVNPLLSEVEANKAWDEVLDGLDLAEARARRKASGPAAGGAPAAAPPAAPQGNVKMIGGKKYVNVNGQWFEDDGT